MTALLIACAVLTAAVVFALLRPLIRFSIGAPGRASYDVQVYRDQLTELDRDISRGVLEVAQADVLRLEIQRRLLAAAGGPEGQGSDGVQQATESNRRWRLVAGIVILIGLPAAAAGLYLRLGAPSVPDAPIASRMNSPDFKSAVMVEQLAEELGQRPSARGYAVLATTLVNMRRYPEAVAAWKMAMDLGQVDAETLSSYGEALTLAQNGMVGPNARQAFLQALSLDRSTPRARFYIGLGYAEIGKAEDALAIWKDLEQSSPPDAPWIEMVRTQIATLASQSKLDPAKIAPHPPSLDGVTPPVTPTADGTRPAASAQDANQDAMIRQMVTRLAEKMKANPDDLPGWLKLSRAYRVLGDLTKAEQAAREALRIKPDGVEPRMALADVQLARAEGDQLPADFIATMRDILTRAPDNTDALYYVGAAEAQVGHKDRAKTLWTTLLGKMPEASPEREDIRKQIEALDKP